MPVMKRDLAIVASADHTRGAALLLAAINPVRMLIVSDHVVELRGRLVVPGTPRASPVDRDCGALIDSQENDVGILGIDPDAVVVVATGRAFPSNKVLTAIGGFVARDVRYKNCVLIFWRDAYPGKVGTSSPDALFVVDAFPVCTRIVRAIHAALRRRIHHGIHALRIARSNGDADASKLIVFPI